MQEYIVALLIKSSTKIHPRFNVTSSASNRRRGGVLAWRTELSHRSHRQVTRPAQPWVFQGTKPMRNLRIPLQLQWQNPHDTKRFKLLSLLVIRAINVHRKV